MKKNFLCMFLVGCSSLICANEQVEPAQEVKKGHSSQDIIIHNAYYEDNWFTPYVEMDMGYRYDTINTNLELLSDIYDVIGARKQKLDLFQLNFKAGMRFLQYLFLKTNVGLGFLISDKDIEASYLNGTDFLVNSYTKTFHKGFGLDWLIGGGFHIPLYKDYVVLEPEIGYDYKRIKVNHSLRVRISSPYAGGSLCFSPGAGVGITFYGEYFFDPALNETGYLYLVKSDSFIPSPTVYTHHHITAYKVGAYLSYLLECKLSLDFIYERFSGGSGYVTGSFEGGLDTFRERLDYWRENIFQFGLRYSF